MGSPFQTVQEYDFEGALVITAFPTTGATSSIAAHFLRKELDLPLVGAIRTDAVPMVVVENGIAVAPVRIFGGDAQCDIRLQESCRHVYVITTELVLAPSSMADMARAILQKADADGAHMVLGLEGVVASEDTDTPGVFMAAAREETLAMLAALDVPRVQKAFLSGMTSELLLAAGDAKTPVAALMVEASQGFPDGHAAAAMLKVLDNLVPHVDMDLGPLEEQASAFEKMIQQAQAEAKRQEVPPPTHSFI